MQVVFKLGEYKETVNYSELTSEDIIEIDFTLWLAGIIRDHAEWSFETRVLH